MIIVLLVGCGSSGPGKRTLNPAKGKVTLGTGAPLTVGTLSLEPLGVGAIPCYGKIEPDGTFELQTDADKGASAGKYKAYILLTPNKRNSVPKKFQSEDTSGIEVEVVSGDNNLEIKLK